MGRDARECRHAHHKRYYAKTAFKYKPREWTVDEDKLVLMHVMRHLVNERRDALDDRAVHSRGPEIDLTVARAASTLPRLSRHEVPVGTRCRVDRDD